jgi:hypothetical protein
MLCPPTRSDLVLSNSLDGAGYFIISYVCFASFVIQLAAEIFSGYFGDLHPRNNEITSRTTSLTIFVLLEPLNRQITSIIPVTACQNASPHSIHICNEKNAYVEREKVYDACWRK